MEQRILKDSASNVRNLAVDKYQQVTSAISSYVSDKPWRAIGIVSTLGLLIGFLAARR